MGNKRGGARREAVQDEEEAAARQNALHLLLQLRSCQAQSLSKAWRPQARIVRTIQRPCCSKHSLRAAGCPVPRGQLWPTGSVGRGAQGQ